MQQIKERGALPMIDRGDIRQAIDRCSNIWASLPGAGCGQFEHKADSSLQRRSGGTVRRLMYGGFTDAAWRHSHHRLPAAMLIITVITPLPTKPSATKMPEN